MIAICPLVSIEVVESGTLTSVYSAQGVELVALTHTLLPNLKKHTNTSAVKLSCTSSGAPIKILTPCCSPVGGCPLVAF